MSRAEFSFTKSGHAKLKGVLDFNSVPDVHQTGCLAIEQSQADIPIEIDLVQISFSDSAGLALLADWMRFAKKQQKTILYVNIPQQMRDIAQVSGILDLLPIK